MNKQHWKSEKGIALILVMALLVIVCLIVLAVNAGRNTFFKVLDTSIKSSIATTKAEDGIAIAYAALRAGSLVGNGGDFTINSDGWTTTVKYHSINSKQYLTSTSSWGDGRYKRSIRVEVSNSASNLPYNNYSFMSDGTMNISNGSYQLNGNSLYAKSNINLTSFWMDGPGKLASSANVNVSNGSMANSVLKNPNASEESFPTPNWDAFANSATKVYPNVSSNLNISNDLKNATNAVIVVKVTGGSPVISIGADNFSNSKATIVIIKDNPNASPSLSVGNGTYSNTNISAFVDGKINFQSGYFKTSGVLFATDDINLINGTYSITGGVVSMKNITTTSVSFGVFDPKWDDYKDYFSSSGVTGLKNWTEL